MVCKVLWLNQFTLVTIDTARVPGGTSPLRPHVMLLCNCRLLVGFFLFPHCPDRIHGPTNFLLGLLFVIVSWLFQWLMASILMLSFASFCDGYLSPVATPPA